MSARQADCKWLFSTSFGANTRPWFSCIDTLEHSKRSLKSPFLSTTRVMFSELSALWKVVFCYMTQIKSAMEKCPRFSWCGAPICPLDPEKALRVSYKNESLCTLGKNWRMKLGNSLPDRGLFPRELAGIKGWMESSAEEKVARLKRLETSPIRSGCSRRWPSVPPRVWTSFVLDGLYDVR